MKTESVSNAAYPRAGLPFVLLLIGFAGPFLTFFLAVSGINYNYKIAGLVGVAAVYLIFCIWSYDYAPSEEVRIENTEPDEIGKMTEEIRGKLLALEEANQYFGTSLKPADMFRLVSNRVRDICPFTACVLFILDETKTKLNLMCAEGRNAERLQGLEIAVDGGLAGMAVASGTVELEADLALEKISLPAEALVGFCSGAAIPLLHDGEVFGVYQLYSDINLNRGVEQTKLLEAIGERIAPLFRSSMAFEQSISSALTDIPTGLPNERAFFMVLENQLAESMRYSEERPLTVLTIDIKGFGEVNTKLGHQTGDRILEFAGARIKEQLRKMDFLARTVNDEFAVILPTASEKTAAEIVNRIEAVFAKTPFAFSENEDVKIRLNFGEATFWKDGDTAQQLIRHARLRKQQAKSEEPVGVLWFPKEYVN